MNTKQIVRDIMNKKYNDVNDSVKTELSRRSYDKIQEMKPEVMKQTFAVEEELELDDSEDDEDTVDENRLVKGAVKGAAVGAAIGKGIKNKLKNRKSGAERKRDKMKDKKDRKDNKAQAKKDIKDMKKKD